MVINGVYFSCDLNEVLTELKQQLTLNSIPLLSKIKESSNDVMVSCPYHNGGQEKRPSAGIRKSDGLFHCFACGEVHTLPEMISHCFGNEDFGVFGWKWLLKNFVSAEVRNRKDIDIDVDRSPVMNSTIEYVSEDELNSYRYIHPYMYKRKLTDDVIELFDIGYDKNTRCITFPVRDETGGCLFVARRSVDFKYFNYPAGVDKPVYGVYELSLLKEFPTEVIICESMLDALSCWVYGKYAVALNGLGNELQFDQLNAMPCRKFILATDNDEAGIKARVRLRKKLTGKLITEYIFPEGRKDINELSKEEFDKLEEVF